MRCPSCGFENPEGMAFCTECGARLQKSCQGCGFENAPQAKFCGKCGTALQAEGPPEPAMSRTRKGTRVKRRAAHPSPRPTAARTRPAPPEAERRQLTVMFCDLVGSTALSEQLDPEEWRAVVQAYQAASAEVIRRFEGYVAQYLGDGLLVYFGYPAAHEDDAQRAARAGLGILAALHDLNTRRQPPVQVRIGIHTGLVVVGAIGEGDKREQLALGDTPNIAARLQGLAEPDTVVISTATYRLIEGLLDCRDLGLHAVKGVSTPLQVYQVVGESGIRSRLDVAVATGLAPLVGREEEVQLLLRRWEQAKTGEGQGVLLSGEAGIGKSRLVQALKEQVAEEHGTQIELRCSPYYQNSALYPLIEHIQRLLHFRQQDTPQDKLDKLEQGLRAYRLPLPEIVPLFATLLSLPHPTNYPPLNVSPQKQKQKIQEALVTWLLAETERRPVVVVCEDLHWVDPSTLEVLGLYIDRVPTARLLLLLTFRPDFRPPWALLSHLTQVTLSRLGRGHVEEIVQRVTGGKALPDEVLQQIVHKTDGVPLFVEELTKMVVESGLLQEAEGHYELTGPLPPLAIPATLREHLDQGLALYDPQQYRSLTWAGALPAVQCLYFGANSLWLLGHPDQALKRIQEALTLAQKLSHPLSQAVVLQWDATLHLLRRERNAAQERAEAVITLSTEHGFSVYSATGTIARGWALAEQGQIEEGIVQIRQGLAALSVIGVEVGRPAFLALLAETYGKVGQAEEGLAVLAEALATVNKTGECWWEAEMYRVKGQLTLQQFQVSGSKFQVDNPQSAFRNWRRKPKRAS